MRFLRMLGSGGVLQKRTRSLGWRVLQSALSKHNTYASTDNGTDKENKVVASNQDPKNTKSMSTAPLSKTMCAIRPPRNDYSTDGCNERRKWVEAYIQRPLYHIRDWWGKSSDATTESLKGHIENPIGLAKIPIGIAGPLMFNGENAQGNILGPLATTEGTLVAAVEKGVKLLNKAGGVKTYVIGKTMMRSPSFTMEDPRQAVLLAEWIKTKQSIFQDIIKKRSRHTILTGFTDVITHDTLHMVFEYETGDAAGQNMTTFATAEIVGWIMKKLPLELPEVYVKEFSLTHGVDGDKKASMYSMLGKRGVNVIAKCTLEDDVLRAVMGTNAEDTIRAFTHFHCASTRVGAVGFSINAANVLASMFIATGQDVASLHESATCIIKATKTPERNAVDLSLHLPSLLIGTIGGGTGLPSQSDCLSIIGCHGDGGVKRLAEVIAGYTLALDIACSSALIANSFDSGHAKLGPKKK
ncbi:unnamed protein product [Owenia fusiformis]|uniref:hydroxymethylglutaryl-CoA reductase (NADPH) n=1 Tax=Owenia fusiformis TaxID=6347 RepID=A0A8J1Y6N0_OWEFU|nr:unnamed protein product [Owenia fusiformis]